MELLGKEKFDWSNISSDFKKMQQISGIIAASGIVLSLFIVFTSKIPKQNFINIWYTIGLSSVFTVIYYLVPQLYGNKKLQFLPDLVFALGIASMMLNLPEDGAFFFVFLMLIIAINAFSMSRGLYLLSFFEIIFVLVLVHYMQGHILSHYIEKEVLFELYGVVTFGIILRIFAIETLSLRKKQEELIKKAKTLSEQKKQIYHLVDNISEGIIAVDKDKKITFLNKSTLKLLGVIGDFSYFVGKDIDEFINTSSADGTISVVDEVLSKKKSVMRDDLRIVRHDKTIRIHTNTAPVFDEQHRIRGAILLFRDITQKYELEEQKAEFNAIASHEIRTPLTVIEGNLYYLLSDNKLKYDKKTKEFLEITHESANNLLRLSNDILTVVRAEENQIKVALEEIDIKEIVNSVVSEHQKQIKDKKIKVSTKFSRNIETVNSDKQKIKEVINNLFENALKFTDKGSVKIIVEQVPKKELIVTIEDSGIGISADDQKMIFQKFYRTEDWQTRKTGGTGLGLYISKTLINRLGGEIHLESTKGKGSKFWFTIPKQTTRAPKKPKQEEKLDEFIHSI